MLPKWTSWRSFRSPKTPRLQGGVSREVPGPHDTVSYFMEVLDLPYFLVCRKTQNSGHFWSLPVHFYSLPVHFWITSGRHFRLEMLVTSGSYLVTSGSYLVTSGILLVTSGPFPVVTSGSKFWSLPVHFR